ncbi:hypothetical protein CCHL11_02186 [Colletotrichum chlorophyti]|uniref:Endoglucanase n=1 Tax=Colletotrichum chlorophyti TaxID=708187 RepID=A0A1Q8S6V8_9PEZI|nr:hypothetical protein CCHL11_02186 [Colletotrichum chlorophyti]
MNHFVFLASTLASTIFGHVVLENPKPFKFVSDGPTNPISSTGEDFPCKVPPGASYEVEGSPTVITIGETFEASFKGQAVHGGGSCQFALSTDKNPTKESRWMVIHSIEGGCPARNQKGNLEGPNEDKYPFQIPASIAPGEYVFAWIWLARVGGQPEYYMNCAPITVQAAKKKRGHFYERRVSLVKREEFPELFMANIGDASGGCTTSEALNAQIPIAFPNPGIYVDHPEGSTNLYKQPCDGNPRAGAPVEGAHPANPSEPAAPTSVRPENPEESSVSSTMISTTSTTSTIKETQPAPSTPVTEPPVPTSVYPSPTTSEVTVTVTVTATITATIPEEVVPTMVPCPSAAPTSIPGASKPATCTEGYLTCLPDETHFATCTGGKLTGPQPIAPGFKCRAGEGEGLDIRPAAEY